MPYVCLQVQSVVDVSKPAYGQLQKLKGKSLDEADTPEKKNSEPKANRLLLLELTDGVLDLQAMEYQPVTQLNPTQLLPGTKVNSVLPFGLSLCALPHCRRLNVLTTYTQYLFQLVIQGELQYRLGFS